MSKIGKNIRRIRKVKNISQSRMAQKINISQATYSKMENGTAIINSRRLEEITRLLKVDKDAIKNFDKNLGLFKPGKGGGNKKGIPHETVARIEESYEEKIALMGEQSRLLKEQNLLLSLQLKTMQLELETKPFSVPSAILESEVEPMLKEISEVAPVQEEETEGNPVLETEANPVLETEANPTLEAELEPVLEEV